MRVSAELEKQILAMPGTVIGRPAATAPDLPLTFAVPVEIVSESNVRECWRAKYRRKKAQRKTVTTFLASAGLLGCGHAIRGKLVVRLTRLMGRRNKAMDAHDNLARAFKSIVDSLAEWLGRDDGDGTIEWRYEQVTAERPGVLVGVERSE